MSLRNCMSLVSKNDKTAAALKTEKAKRVVVFIQLMIIVIVVNLFHSPASPVNLFDGSKSIK